MTQRRTVFFVSDGTGITAQMLGHSLLTQFEGVEFNQVTLPFVDSTEKAEDSSHRGLGQADVILIGVSRRGKTPTSLYLALQFGLKAANYPLIPEDFHRGKLPEALRPQKPKLFGLTIAPERLHEIRKERRPDSRYAALDNCRYEVEEAEKLMRRDGIHSINSTTKSIEEIATTILRELRIQRQGY